MASKEQQYRGFTNLTKMNCFKFDPHYGTRQIDWKPIPQHQHQEKMIENRKRRMILIIVEQ